MRDRRDREGYPLYVTDRLDAVECSTIKNSGEWRTATQPIETACTAATDAAMTTTVATRSVLS